MLNLAAFRRTLVVGALGVVGIDDLGYGDTRDWVATNLETDQLALV